MKFARAMLICSLMGRGSLGLQAEALKQQICWTILFFSLLLFKVYGCRQLLFPIYSNDKYRLLILHNHLSLHPYVTPYCPTVVQTWWFLAPSTLTPSPFLPRGLLRQLCCPSLSSSSVSRFYCHLSSLSHPSHQCKCDHFCLHPHWWHGVRSYPRFIEIQLDDL